MFFRTKIDSCAPGALTCLRREFLFSGIRCTPILTVAGTLQSALSPLNFRQKRGIIPGRARLASSGVGSSLGGPLIPGETRFGDPHAEAPRQIRRRPTVPRTRSRLPACLRAATHGSAAIIRDSRRTITGRSLVGAARPAPDFRRRCPAGGLIVLAAVGRSGAQACVNAASLLCGHAHQVPASAATTLIFKHKFVFSALPGIE